MIFQDVFIERVIIVLTLQLWPIIYCSYFVFKLLKREKTRLMQLLIWFFILNMVTFLLPFFTLFLLINPLGYFLYIFAFYVLIFSQTLLIIFSMDVLKVYDKLPFKKHTTWIIIYAILCTYVFFFGIPLNGITYDASTSWRPIFSVNFLIINWIFLTSFIIVPEVIFSLNLSKYINDKKVRKKIWKFTISLYLEVFLVYNIILYNTWVDNYIYRTLYTIFSLPIGFSAALLIYLSFGKPLE